MNFSAPLQAVLFDVDGTLLDTTEFIYQGFEHALRTHGYPARSRADFARVMGWTLSAGYLELAPGCDDALLCRTHRAFQTRNLHLARPYPDAAAVLGALRDAGLRLAAITTRSRYTSTDTLVLAGLAEYLDPVLSFEDVANIKPHPEPLLLALDRLGVPPESALMVGDTDADILAGRAAGVRTVGVTYGFHGSGVAAHTPDLVIDALLELLPICGVPS
jgi:pyrophosphatase PpaX